MSASPYSVLVVDDDYYALDAIQQLLARDTRTRIWASANSIDAAVALLEGETGPTPDVILLDVQFGDDRRAGILGLPRIANSAPTAKTLMTSVLRDEDVVLSAIAAGADGYVWKNESGSGIASAIQGVAEGRFVMTPSIAELVLGQADDLKAYAADILAEEPAYANLTSSLKKTLYLFCLCGLSVREIATELQLSPHTINSRIRAAYQALGAGSRHEAFALLVERGRNGVDHG
jgi:DNA-binding NarL/FixJ family response regulator